MRTLVALFALVTLVACGNDSATGPSTASVAGSWSLQSYNGNRLPFTILQSGTTKAELTQGTLALESNGIYNANLTLRVTSNGVVTTQVENDRGTFTVSGTTVSFRSSDPASPPANASLSGNTLTYTDDGVVFVFLKS